MSANAKTRCRWTPRAAIRFAILLFFAVWAGFAQAQNGPEQALQNADARLSSWEAEAARVEAALSEGSPDGETAAELRALVDPQRELARTLADAAKKRLTPLQEQMTALGPAPAEGESEDASLAAERAELQKKIDELKAIASKADLAYTRADRLVAEIAETQRARFTERLLTRGPTPLRPDHWVTAGQSVLGSASAVASETLSSATDGQRTEVWSESGPLALTGLLFAIVVMVVARRWALNALFGALGGPGRGTIDAETEAAAFGGLSASDGESGPLVEPDRAVAAAGRPAPSRPRRLLVGIGVTLTRLALPLMAIIAVRVALLALQVLGPTGEAFLDGVTRGAVVLAAGYALIYAFFAPSEPRLRLSMLNDRKAAGAAWLSMLLAFTLALDIAVLRVGEGLDWPNGALAVLNAVLLSIGAVALWRLARITAPDRHAHAEGDGAEDAVDEAETWLSARAALFARRAAYAVAVSAPLLALAGYYALSRYVFFNALVSAAVIGMMVLIYSVAKEVVTALSEATRGRGRGGKGVKEGEEDRPSLLPVFVGFILILIAIPILALIWGATANDLGEAYYAMTTGFTVGETTFRPGDIVIAALVFGLALFVTRVIQAVMRRTVLPRTKLDAGARSSIVAGLGYVGFFVSALVAIGAAGLDLTNLAFLGAALGVGIGFGLQNIVNNFVSGIILLIERPIKIGDWIEVAGTHGTVKKVNVRSTEIETFDKASYIVPNSELISGAVMNMTHGDLMGRVIAPVGVAYGTDTRKVEKILLEIARAHPMVLRRPAPFVVFTAFGADSLDFELRAYLRDVNWVLTTRSDFNFEIDRRFREEGIEVPFRQTDVHVKDLDKLVAAVRPEVERRAPSRVARPGAPLPADGDGADGDY